MEFQELVGYPDMDTRIFIITIIDRETKKRFLKYYVPAKSPIEAERKSREAISFLAKHQDPLFWKKQKVEHLATTTFEPQFEGNDTPSPTTVLDQARYIAACPGFGINLDIQELGSYSNCQSCSQREVCLKEAKRSSIQDR